MKSTVQAEQLERVRLTHSFKGNDSVDLKLRSMMRVFLAFLLLQVLVYLEAGALPALLATLLRYFSMSYVFQGLLGGSVYLLVSLASPVYSWMLNNKWMPTSRLLAVSILINSFGSFLFGACPIGWPVRCERGYCETP